MSTYSEREEALRRALFSAAESIEPGADGIERIRARLGTPRPTLVAWIEGVWSELLRRCRVFIEDLSRRVAGGIVVVWERFGPKSRASHRRTGPLSWLSPMAAMTVAIVVVAVGAYMALSGTVFGFNSAGLHSSNSNGPGAGRSNSGAGQAKASSPENSSTWPNGHPDPSPSSPCKTASPNPTFVPPPSHSPSPSPSTGTSSPGSTGSPSPSTTTSPGTANTAAPGNAGAPVTTAFLHSAVGQCGKKKPAHKSTSTAAKVTVTVPGGTFEVVFAARITAPAAKADDPVA